MPKIDWRKLGVAIPFGLAALVAITGAILSQLSYENRHGQHPQAQAAERIQEHGSEGLVGRPPDQPTAKQKEAQAERPVDWVAITGLLVSFAGLLLLLRTFYLQRIATVGDLRAYIRLDVASSVIAVGQPVSVTLRPTNYGKTPARDVTVIRSIFIRKPTWKYGDEPDPPPTKEELTAVILHPDDKAQMVATIRGADKKPFIMTQQVFNDVMKGDLCIFARGWVIYRDVFKQRRETEMRFEFSGPECAAAKHWRASETGSRAT